MPSPQRALQAGPGRFHGLLTFDADGVENREGRERVLSRAAALLRELESEDLRDKPLRILVAVAPRLLDKHTDWKALSAEYVKVKDFHLTEPALLTQIAAETEDDRTFALRLIQRVFDGALKLREECYGGRHLLSREAFGYRDNATWPEEKPVPESKAVPGGSWLLYQECVQNLDSFYALDAEAQDRIVGRRRDDPPHTAPTQTSHIEFARKNTLKDGSPLLLRRSFSYETYADAGMVFLACAAHTDHLRRAYLGIDADPLKDYIRLAGGGIYFVPPHSSWLAPGDETEVLSGSKRPPAERSFFPERPLLLYEVTPKTQQFFLRAFHENRENFDENGALREDLKLTAKGMAKILYGGHLLRGTAIESFLQLIYGWDLSDGLLTDPVVELIEELRREKKDGASEARIGELRAQLRASLATDDNLRKQARELANTPLLELIADVVCSDAEYLAGSTPARRDDFESLVHLCTEAADEARAVNTAAGSYMTIMC